MYYQNDELFLLEALGSSVVTEQIFELTDLWADLEFNM